LGYAAADRPPTDPRGTSLAFLVTASLGASGSGDPSIKETGK
jgi:hypothetical protein